MTRIILCFLLLTLTQPASASPPQVDMASWYAWVKTCCEKYGVDENLAWAVMIVETRPKGGNEFEIRMGPIGEKGKYVGPMGLNKCFANKYDIYNPLENIRIGIKALRGNELRALKRYNASFNWSYYKEIMRIKSKLNQGAIYSIKIASHKKNKEEFKWKNKRSFIPYTKWESFLAMKNMKMDLLR